MKVLNDSEQPRNLEYMTPQRVMQLWNPNVRMVDDDDENSISIFDPIGEGFFSPGVTAKRIDAALRQIGKRDVTVNINSPGGLFFEGIAIYNLLRAHRGAIKVNVIGIAASAASVIAMAGDEIVMNRGSQMMVHNPMACACGDYRFMQDTVNVLKGFRDSAVEIYETRTGRTAQAIRKILDAETFMTAEATVAANFADRVDDLPLREEEDDEPRQLSERSKLMGTLKHALARDGLTRRERSAIFQQLGLVASMTDQDPSAASMTGTPEGDAELLRNLHNLATKMKG